MTRRFTIKKEIRSLGIDLCNPGSVIGAVIRGGLYLDGIVVFSPNPKRWSSSIAKSVVQTRFYPELKLIMTHDPDQNLNPRQVERITGLPVIDIRTPGKTTLERFERFSIGQREVLARSSLETKIVQEILAITWTAGSLPEPLRVAHLIAKSRFLRKKTGFLG